MKLNIKGLVFVGFAAAVFASAANAAGENDSKTVTSKTYVDTEVAKKVTKNDAITGATKTKITYDAKGLVTAGADLVASDIPDISATYQLKSERVTNLDTPNDTTYPTTKAVADAISADDGEANVIETVKVNGTALTPDANKAVDVSVPVTTVKVNGTALTPDSSHAVDVTVPTQVQPDWDATSGLGEILHKPTDIVNTINTVKVNGTPLTIDANKAVDVTVPTQVQPDWNATSGLGEILNKPTDIVNTINTVKVNGTPLTIDGNKAVDITVPSVGVTIPAPTTGNCGQGAPCALVIEAGTVTWEPIQQAQ